MAFEQEIPYSISYDNPNYEKSLYKLRNPEHDDLLEKIETLKIDPFSIATPLHKPYEGKYAVRIYGKRYRLIVTINVNSRNVRLWYVEGRGDVYIQ